MVAFATVPLADFVMVAGEPRRRRSSAFGERWFCGDCGTQLAMRVDHQPDTIDFTLASLDNPGSLRPTFHLFCAERISWFDTRDTFRGTVAFGRTRAGYEVRPLLLANGE